MVNYPVITDNEVRTTFLNLFQAMTTQDQVLTTQIQAITTQENREVSPYVNQNSSTMASRVRDFTRINPPIFFESKVNEDPQNILGEVCKILYAIEVSSNVKSKIDSYKLKDVSQTFFSKWNENMALREGPII